MTPEFEMFLLVILETLTLFALIVSYLEAAEPASEGVTNEVAGSVVPAVSAT